MSSRISPTGREEVEITARIAEAREHGDLKENAEYDAAKNEQGMMEARIRKLTHLLESAEVREVENSGLVEIGTVVTVIDDDEDEYGVLRRSLREQGRRNAPRLTAEPPRRCTSRFSPRRRSELRGPGRNVHLSDRRGAR